MAADLDNGCSKDNDLSPNPKIRLQTVCIVWLAATLHSIWGLRVLIPFIKN